MAGDWIKMRTDLYRDPKVCVMGSLLSEMLRNSDVTRDVTRCATETSRTVTRSIARCACVGALVSVWGVLRHRGKRVGDDLCCAGVTLAVIDDIADIPGFGDVMAHVGWVAQDDEGIVLPRFFSEYNADPSGKEKTPAAERQARYRRNKMAQPNVTETVTPSVTRDAQRNVTRDVTVAPREEKNREEKIEAAEAAAPASAGMVLFSDLEHLPSEEKKETTGARNSPDVIAVFDAYRKHHPRAFAKPVPTSKEWRAIAARLREGFTVDDLVEAIEGCHVSPFHCGENDRQTPYQSLSLIVRDGSQVNNFIELARKGPTPVLSEKNQRGQRAAQSFLARFHATEGGEDEPMVS
jgi:hypothetical protein